MATAMWPPDELHSKPWMRRSPELKPPGSSVELLTPGRKLISWPTFWLGVWVLMNC